MISITRLDRPGPTNAAVVAFVSSKVFFKQANLILKYRMLVGDQANVTHQYNFAKPCRSHPLGEVTAMRRANADFSDEN